MSYSFDCVNKKGIDWGVDIDSMNYIKRSDMEGSYKVNGLFFHNKGNYGRSGVVILDDALVDLPAHQVEQMEEMTKNIPEFVEDIKAGKVFIRVYHYDTDTRKNCVGFEFFNN